MKYSTVAVAASFASLALAQDSNSTDAALTAEINYISDVCAPLNATGQPDLNAPCNQVTAIELECLYGPKLGLEVFFSSYATTTSPDGFQSTGESDLPTDLMQSNVTQRDCMCSSQFWSAFNACETCQVAHGDTYDVDQAGQGVASDLLASLSSTYCAVSSTPTLGLGDYFSSWGMEHDPSSTPTSVPTTFSDPLGVNKTAVSLYYTPSITGTPAYVVAASTGSVTASGTESITLVTFPSLKTSNGQILATAVANNAAASNSGSSSTGTGKHTGTQAAESGSPSGSSSSKPTTGGAPAPTHALAAAGIIGLAGLAVLL